MLCLTASTLVLSFNAILAADKFSDVDASNTVSIVSETQSRETGIIPIQTRNQEELFARSNAVLPREGIPTPKDVDRAYNFLITRIGGMFPVVEKRFLYAALNQSAEKEVLFNNFSLFLTNITMAFGMVDESERRGYILPQDSYDVRQKVDSALYKTSGAYHHFQVFQHFIQLFADWLTSQGIALEGDYPVVYVYENQTKPGVKVYSTKIIQQRNLKCIDKLFFSKDKHGYVAYTSYFPQLAASKSHLKLGLCFGDFENAESRFLIFKPKSLDHSHERISVIEEPGVYVETTDINARNFDICAYRGVKTVDRADSMVGRGFSFSQKKLAPIEPAGLDINLNTLENFLKEHLKWTGLGTNYSAFIPKTSVYYPQLLAYLFNMLERLDGTEQNFIKDLLVEFCSLAKTAKNQSASGRARRLAATTVESGSAGGGEEEMLAKMLDETLPNPGEEVVFHGQGSGWIETAVPVKKDNTQASQKTSKKKKGKKSKENNASAQVRSIVATEAEKAIERFAQMLIDEIPEGRLNPDEALKVLNILIEMATSNSALRIKSINQVSSHIYFHFHNGPTYCHVIKHGKKDRTVSAGEMKRAAKDLASIAAGAAGGRA